MKNTQINFYETNGKTYSIREFIEEYRNFLSDYEQKVVDKIIVSLPSSIPDEIPIPIQKNWRLRKKIWKFNTNPEITLTNNGERSAYDPKGKIKFKGCNPQPNHSKYPNNYYYFGTNNLIHKEEERWGVMEPDQVVREIMAIGFLEQNNLPNILEPLAVYEYKNKKSLGFCLIEKSEYNERLRDIANDTKYSRDSNQRLAYFNHNLFKKLVPFPKVWLSEEKLKAFRNYYAKEQGLSLEELTERLESEYNKPKGYTTEFTDEIIEKQTELLINLHFNGFFRNVVNGHTGNTIITPNRNFYFCDFDATNLIDIPKTPNERFMRDFYLASIMEVMESDFRYLTHINHSDTSTTEENKKEIFNKVHSKYLEISQYFKEYLKKFDKKTRELGWDRSLLEKAIKEAEKTNIYFNMIIKRISNDYFLANYHFSCGYKNPYLKENN